MGNGHVWAMDMYGQWTCMGNEHVWAMDMYGQWTCMGNEHVGVDHLLKQKLQCEDIDGYGGRSVSRTMFQY